tara:strand:- start:1577 stop:1816 length:240 start_codon:yes stop_codon:yes gene_type:complete
MVETRSDVNHIFSLTTWTKPVPFIIFLYAIGIPMLGFLFSFALVAHIFRLISSEVEHLVYTEAVGGSIPSSSISTPKKP